MIDKLSDGSWLTLQRLQMIPILTGIATALMLAFLFITAAGTLDFIGRPLGTDFSNVWTAGRMALEGAAPDVWDWSRHFAVQRAFHGNPNVDVYGWHYPPPFLLIAAVLATMPYVVALVVWQIVTLTAAILVVRRIVPDRRTVLTCLGAPIVYVCIGHGQNAFLTAALLGGGLLFLNRRPVIAGLLLGCLVYKPQLALVIPPLLAVTGKWKALLGAAISAMALIGVTLAIWGWPVWQAFLDSLPLTRHVIIENGATGWEKIQSPFAMIRMWGGGITFAYLIQGLFTTAAIAATLLLARRAPSALRNAAAMAAVMLSTPYVLDYDFVVLGMGAAFLIADGRHRGFLRFEKSLIALIWIAPLVARQLANVTLFPLGQLTASIVLVLAVRRAILLDGTLSGFKALSFRH